MSDRSARDTCEGDRRRWTKHVAQVRPRKAFAPLRKGSGCAGRFQPHTQVERGRRNALARLMGRLAQSGVKDVSLLLIGAGHRQDGARASPCAGAGPTAGGEAGVRPAVSLGRRHRGGDCTSSPKRANAAAFCCSTKWTCVVRPGHGDHQLGSGSGQRDADPARPPSESGRCGDHPGQRFDPAALRRFVFKLESRPLGHGRGARVGAVLRLSAPVELSVLPNLTLGTHRRGAAVAPC